MPGQPDLSIMGTMGCVISLAYKNNLDLVISFGISKVVEAGRNPQTQQRELQKTQGEAPVFEFMHIFGACLRDAQRNYGIFVLKCGLNCLSSTFHH